MPLNILHVCDHLGWPGSRMHGAKRILEILLPRFDRERFRPHLVSLRGQDLSEARLEDRGIAVTYLGRGKFDPRTLTDLVAFIRAKEIDLIHMHGYGASTFGRLAARVTKIPAVIHEHANLINPPAYQALPDWLLAGNTDYTIAVSETTRDFCVRSRRLPASKVHVHYFGTDLADFTPPRPGEAAALKLKLGLPGDGPLVATVTRLHPQKGNSSLIQAWPEVVARVPDVTLAIAGEGPLLTELQEQAQALGVGDSVRFLGFVDGSRQVFGAADVIAFSSLWEGTPLTLFEAMAVGGAIVATAVDGNAEVLTHEQDGLLVPPADPRALAAAICRLLAEPALAKRLAERVTTTAKRYDVNRFVRELEGIYAKLLGREDWLDQAHESTSGVARTA